MNDGKKSRRRRSSSLLYQEPPESMEHISDQAASPNLNAGWVNAKGELVLSSALNRGGQDSQSFITVYLSFHIGLDASADT